MRTGATAATIRDCAHRIDLLCFSLLTVGTAGFKGIELLSAFLKLSRRSNYHCSKCSGNIGQQLVISNDGYLPMESHHFIYILPIAGMVNRVFIKATVVERTW